MTYGLTREAVTAQARMALEGAMQQRDAKTIKECLDLIRQLGNDRATEQDNTAISLLAELNAVPTALYRHFDREGRLLYVGVSLSAIQRTKQHHTNAPWFREITRIELTWFGSRSSAELAEEHAIKAEKPLYNVTYNQPCQH
jgi:excinuclease UvrABC nuclease subunit